MASLFAQQPQQRATTGRSAASEETLQLISDNGEDKENNNGNRVDYYAMDANDSQAVERTITQITEKYQTIPNSALCRHHSRQLHSGQT